MSSGPSGPVTVPVPDVVGQPAADAQSTLESQGFSVTSSDAPSTDVDAGLVISQNPTAGAQVAPGSSVAIVVSTGAGAGIVPDLVGLSIDDATTAATAAGFAVSFIEDPDDPDPDGIVVSQDPTTGAETGSNVVAQLSPDFGEPWSILVVDQNRLMTASGTGLLAGSTVRLSVVNTDLDTSVAVQENGTWTAAFDLSSVANDREILLIEGIAADSSDYEATFTIPEVGKVTSTTTQASSSIQSGCALLRASLWQLSCSSSYER